MLYRKGHELSSAPATEPLDRDTDVKEHLRIDGTAEDDLLDRLITAVREETEDYTGRALITQTRKLYIDGFPVESFIELPFPPLQSVTSITTINDAGTETEFSSSNYTVHTYDSKAGVIQLKDGQSWPTDIRPAAGVVIEYICGYGDAASDVPATLRLAMRDLVAHRFAFRGDEEPPAFDNVFLAFDRYKNILL